MTHPHYARPHSLGVLSRPRRCGGPGRQIYMADDFKQIIQGLLPGGLMKARIAIPVHNACGDLVAYAGRWIGEAPEGERKYKLPMGIVKTAVLFNLNRAKEPTRGKGELIVTEGYFTVFKLFQYGVENAVALMGAHLSEQQKELLVETLGPQGRVVLLFDNDEAGQAGSAKAAEELINQLFVKVVKLPERVAQPDELTDEELQRIVAG